MTKKIDKINYLRNIQKRKRKQVETLKKRMFKHLLWLTIITLAFSLYGLEGPYKLFGTVTKFILILTITLVSISLVYLLIFFYISKKNQKDIRIIDGQLYKLMKLNND